MTAPAELHVCRDFFAAVAAGLQAGAWHRYVWGMEEVFKVSDAAAAQIAAIAGDAGTALRVSVLAGGCNGFQYKFALDEAVSGEDLVIERGRARVVVDKVSLDLLGGAELDYVDALMGSYFRVKNPNAASSCGCGSSFSVD